MSWKDGHLYMSAPSIYYKVMESLQLERGLSFLNLGSGTGYISIMAGLILGPYGINHGIELQRNWVQYAYDRIDEFELYSDIFDKFEFCKPKFVIGNCLQLNPNSRDYDRVYCGAACPAGYENYMKNLINVGGILVMSVDDQLLQIHRISETSWETKHMAPASFGTFILPTREAQADTIALPDFMLPSLLDVARFKIRDILRGKTQKDYPNLKNNRSIPKPIKNVKHYRRMLKRRTVMRDFDDVWDYHVPYYDDDKGHGDDGNYDVEDEDEYFSEVICCPKSEKRDTQEESDKSKDRPNDKKEFPDTENKLSGKISRYIHEDGKIRPQGTFSMYLRENIKQLPLPQALRSFLVYYRA